MESIEKLRKYADGFVTVQTHDDLMGLIDEIEAEISERYMLLPELRRESGERMSEYIVTGEQLNFFMGYMPEDAMIPAKMAHLQPIVRCRDCKYYMHSSWHMCDLHSIAHEVKPDGFCAWGEK